MFFSLALHIVWMRIYSFWLKVISRELNFRDNYRLKYKFGRNCWILDSWNLKLLLFSCSVVSNSLWPHGLQHARLPCPSPSPRALSNSCPLRTWCHLILCCPLLLLPSIFPSIRVFSNELAVCIRWPKCWSFNFSISPSNDYSGLISFRVDWYDLFAVQGTLKSLLQHHSSKASILRHSAFLMVQLSHPYMTTGKTIALTMWAFVGKVMSLFLIHCLGLSKLFF